MKTSVKILVLGAMLLAVPTVMAQAHYPAGSEGIKAASLPPPGVYFRDYNQFYFADEFKDGPGDFEIFAYVNAPRVIWITDFKILGGYYGMDALIPLGYIDVKGGGIDDNRFSVGDVCVEPITLSWHTKQFDVALAYAFWAPTGSHDEPADLGKGFWSHMLTAGATWYIDEQKTWSVSALNRYEIHHEHEDSGVTPGNTWTLEWGIAKSVTKTVELGVVGYYQAQTTDDDPRGNMKESVAAIGPEISAFCSKLGLFTSLRYLREFGAKNHAEGNNIMLTFTKRF